MNAARGLFTPLFGPLSRRLASAFMLVTLSFTAACAQESAEFERAEKALATAEKYDYVITTSKGPVIIKVRLALDDATRNRGLMYLRAMPKKAGMLFIYPGVGVRSFWMKNTYIPLDLIYVKRNGEISLIRKNVPPLTLDSRSSNGKVLAVLELNGGEAEKLGIKVGDTAKVPRKWRLMADW